MLHKMRTLLPIIISFGIADLRKIVTCSLAIAFYVVVFCVFSKPAPEAAKQVIESLPPYSPTMQVSGTVNLWGHGSPKHDFMGTLIDAWIRGFKKYQPRVTFINHMYGTASAVGALSMGAGNIALLGEEISPAESTTFKRKKGYAPTRIEIATGSVDSNYFDYAHMIFVNRVNPLRSLTLVQLDGIFGAEHRRGVRNLRVWGALGLTRTWAHAHIQPYSWEVGSDFALFFRDSVLEGSHRWNMDLRQFQTTYRSDGTRYDRGQKIIDALAKDPRGIAISNIRFANSNVRILPIARDQGGPTYLPTPSNLISQKYPLVRIIPAFIDVPPNKPVDPTIREFLRYILSRQGQQALIEYTGYLPLGNNAIHRQLEKLR